jgi:hypothetical protein
VGRDPADTRAAGGDTLLTERPTSIELAELSLGAPAITTFPARRSPRCAADDTSGVPGLPDNASTGDQLRSGDRTESGANRQHRSPEEARRPAETAASAGSRSKTLCTPPSRAARRSRAAANAGGNATPGTRGTARAARPQRNRRPALSLAAGRVCGSAQGTRGRRGRSDGCRGARLPSSSGARVGSSVTTFPRPAARILRALPQWRRRWAC